MGTFSIWHWLIVLVVVLILFGGRGKISQLMGDFGRGLKSFKKNMRDDEPFEDDDPARRGEARALPGETARTAEPAGDRPGERFADRDRATRS
jgi:sec-independent protein translocase protein TatA